MGRHRHSKGKKRGSPDPADVLEGKVEIRADELFNLIHQVNPTGRELPGAEETRRYAQKARLQSLLIRRFGDRHLEVKPGDHDGVVSLAHRLGTRDACHAVVAELDADSRSWIQRRLDVEAAPDDADADRKGLGARRSSAGAGFVGEEATATAGELLRRGQQALNDYDYEAAERHLRLALERSGGGTEPALALLELLVGLLGMDRQGLETEPQLAARAKADPGVRALLALAEARAGDSERALQRTAGIAGPEAAEVHAALAARAIQGRDPEAASRRLETAKELDPVHPRLQSLAGEIAALRAESQRPAEEKLEQRFRQQGCLAAEDDARALLDRWPESLVARQILREVATHRRTEEIAKHLEDGEKALAEESFGKAAVHLQAAVDAGSERADLPGLIERARERERQQRETARLDAAVDRFSSGGLKPALLGYLSLPETLRRRVRRRVDRPALAWLEEAVAHAARGGRQHNVGPRSGAKAQAAVAAVLALERAIDELRAGRAQAALGELSPHNQALADVAEARRCLQEARSQLATARRARAREVLAAAREAYEEARIERSRELLESVDLADFAARDRPAAEDLQAEIQRFETVRQLEHELERHAESKDFLGALQRTHQLVDHARDPGEQKRWRHRAGELRGRIRTAWRLEILSGETPLEEVRDFDLETLDDMPRFWLDDAGNELVLAAAWADRLFIRVVDVERGRVVSRVSLKTPEPLGRPLAACRDGDRLRVAGPRGDVLELETGTWDVLGWSSLRELLPAGVAIETVILLPGSPFVWLRVQMPSTSWQFWVVDLKARRISRKLPLPSTVLPIVGPGEPRVVVSGIGYGARLFAAIGTSESTEPLFGRYVTSAAISPDGEGLALAVERLRLDDDPAPDWVEEDEVGLMLLLAADPEHGEAAEVTSGVRLDDVYADGANVIATSLDQGLMYVLVQYGTSERELLTLATPKQSFDVLHQIDVPLDTVLVQDRRSRHVAALMTGEHFFDVVPLGRGEPPVTALPEPRTRGDRLLPIVGEVFFCGKPTGATNAHVLALLGWWNEMPAAELKQHVEARARKHAGDPDELVPLCLALNRQEGLEVEEEKIVRELARRHPRHGGAALLLAELEGRAGNWPDVARVLGRADPQDLEEDDGRACHFYHLLGIAHLRAGRTTEALAAFEGGAGIEHGTCMIQPLIHLTRPMSDPPEPHEHDPEQPVVRQLLGAIRLADRALAAGDPAGALAALDRQAVWHGAELQSAARLAAAYLETPSSNPSERFRKRLALALYRHVYEAREKALVEILLPGLSWDEGRLAEVASRAAAWLEEDFGMANSHDRI